MINWEFQGKPITSIDQFPEGAIGIIYLISNVTKGKSYYGRKTCVRMSKQKLTKKDKLLPENKRKTFKYVQKEYAWKNYTGSNEELNLDIKNGDQYTKEILRFCFTKAEMTYYETKAIVCSDCMTSENCYNSWFSAKVFKSQLLKND